MSRFLLPISRNWIGEEFYGTKYALSVAAPHAVSPFLYAKCVLFACGASPNFPRAASYCNGFLQALRSGAIDSDLVQYVEHFDRSALGRSPGLRKKDENELKLIRTLTPMQHRTMICDAIKAAVFLRGRDSPNALKQIATGRQQLMDKLTQVSAHADSVYAQKHQQQNTHRPDELQQGGASSRNNHQSLHDNVGISDSDILFHENGKAYIPLEKLQEITPEVLEQQIIHRQFKQQKMFSMIGDQMSRYHQSFSSAASGAPSTTSGPVSASETAKKGSSSSSIYQQSNSSNNSQNTTMMKKEMVSSQRQQQQQQQTDSFATKINYQHRQASSSGPSTNYSGNLREAPRSKNNSNNNNNNNNNLPQQQQQQPEQQQHENIHVHNVTYDQSLECLKEIFEDSQLYDLDVLGRELGLSPDVVVKACEIAVRERDVTKRKAKLFEDLV